MSGSPQTIGGRDAASDSNATFRAEVLDGLSHANKTLPCKYFYDAEGARLFDRICDVEEYYPTRAEVAILEAHAGDMARAMGPDTRLVELGSGEGRKTPLLLGALERPSAYVPVDISNEQLEAVAARLRAQFPALPVTPVVADYTRPFRLPPAPRGTARTCVYFAGSTIGNFEPEAAKLFLATIARLVGRGGGLLIGVDLRKDTPTLEAAYDDRHGVTAAFNLNLLARINRELDGAFQLDAFAHQAVYDEAHGRIEMHLVSRRAQLVAVGDRVFSFRRGEVIVTEHSYKYDLDGFQQLGRAAGFDRQGVWVDPLRRFSVQYFRALR